VTTEAPASATSEGELEGEPGFAWWKVLVLGLALAFLVGAAGYLMGTRANEPVPTSSVDEGFLADMTTHHDQAVEMALLALNRAEDPTVRHFATEVLLFQRYELGRMRSYQQERGIEQPEYDPDRPSMSWMGMPTPVAVMPGMASDAQIDELAALSGSAFDERFLELMMAHHRGGAHMSEYAADHAADPDIRQLAQVMLENQLIEVNEYQIVLDRLRAQQ
jgi:uncharacterized protein (DUF305 family)